jgi:hypothetical protein
MKQTDAQKTQIYCMKMQRHETYRRLRISFRRLILQVDSGLIYTNLLRGTELALLVAVMVICKREDSRTHADGRRMPLTLASAFLSASFCKLTHA